MNKSISKILIGAMSFAGGIAQADQCAWTSQSQANASARVISRMAGLTDKNPAVYNFCEPCLKSKDKIKIANVEKKLAKSVAALKDKKINIEDVNAEDEDYDAYDIALKEKNNMERVLNKMRAGFFEQEARRYNVKKKADYLVADDAVQAKIATYQSFRTGSVVKDRSYREVVLKLKNGVEKKIDAAYTYIETAPNTYVSLAYLSGCPSREVGDKVTLKKDFRVKVGN